MHRSLLGLGLLVAASAAAQTRVPQNHTIHSSVEAGHQVRVIGYASFTRDCRPKPPPRIVIVTPPSHGTLEVRPGKSTVSILRPNSPDCTGNTYDAAVVWYVPAPGFHGIDQADWRVVNETNDSDDTAIIEVR